MKRVWTFSLSGLAVAGAVTLSCVRPSIWTTDSPEARAAFEDCLEAEMKAYHREALERCRDALRADPGFVVAKLKVAQQLTWEGGDDPRAAQLEDELREADLESLHPTERLLVSYALLRWEGQRDAALHLVDDHLARHPDDPFALDLKCRAAWTRDAWEEAEECHRRLLEVDPNWVLAQNRRGYAAMAQGKFDIAEDHFRTYLYIAPDQANPHDSMAELLTLRGRYDEAEASLEAALEIRPDFCPSFEHLVSLYLLQGRIDAARQTLQRRDGQEACAPAGAWDASRCKVELWDAMFAGDWRRAAEVSAQCVERTGEATIFGHRAALETGRLRDALAYEEEMQREIADLADSDYKLAVREAGAVLSHLRGVRLLHRGEASAAAAELTEADRAMAYWDSLGPAIFKLYNMAYLASAQRAAGDAAAAAATWEKLGEVNPAFRRQLEGDETSAAN